MNRSIPWNIHLFLGWEQTLIKERPLFILMDIFHDYAFVVNGKKRKEVVKLLDGPRTPTEIAKMLKVHANVITRILKDLTGRELVECYQISGNKRTYMLTKKGDLAREVLNNLVEPKTFMELMKHLKAHRKMAVSLVKHVLHDGFVTFLKSFNSSRKIYRLTRSGEAVREKLE
jgi:predicted transcriptional regulator